jgi:CubicO group peptidase (beta-lactamase class C family)
MNTLARPLILLSILLVVSPGRAQTKSETPQAPKTFDLPAIDAYLAAQVKDKGFVGLSVALLHDGKLVFAKGYGKSSLENDRPVEKNTRFAIGSVTKQFTCACILLLAEEGKLSVQDKVAKWYPDLTRATDISIYDLMTHASGYPDYYPLDFVDRRLMKPIAPDKLLQEYAGGKLDFEPGTRWSYSNTGYVLLGRIVEKVSGESFGTFLERRILKPLGMEHTVFEPKQPGARFAVGYSSFALGAPEAAIPEADGWCHAAGALYASASDLAKWDLALMSGKVLKPESYKLMTTPRQLTTGKTKNYGCGLSIGQRENETVLSHGGAVSGFLAQNALLPATRSAVVLLTNSEFVDPHTVHDALVYSLLKHESANVEVPHVALSARDAAAEMLSQLTRGEIDRSKLGEFYSEYLTKERIQGASARLKPLGEPTAIHVDGTSERGGMEVAVVRFTFKTAALRALLYRTPDGKIQEFLLNRE